MTNKKVLNIIQRYHPAKGGAELFIKLLSEYQVKELGFDVDVWTTNAFNASTLWDLEGETIPYIEKEKIEGVNVKRFPIGKGILRNKHINKLFRVLFENNTNFRLSNLATCPTSFSMLDDIKSDSFKVYDFVTVSSTPYFFLFYVGYLISKKLNIPYIIAPALHTGEEMRNKYLKKTTIPFYQQAYKIIFNTKKEGQVLLDYCKENGVNLDVNKFVIVGQGVFLNEINGGNGEKFRKKYSLEGPIVFQVGSKNKEKGSYSLVEAMKTVWDKGEKANLVFGGLFNEEFSKYLNNLDIKYRDKILNIDNITDDEKWDLYDAGDIFSMISKTDSFGIVYLEAWSYRKPVLGCKNDVMKEIISDEEDGFLIEFDNVDKIAEKILYLLKNDKDRIAMGRMGREKVEKKYQWENNLQKLAEIYKKL